MIEDISSYFALMVSIFSVITAMFGVIFFVRIKSRQTKEIKNKLLVVFGLLAASYLVWSIAEVIWSVLSLLGKDPAFGIAEYFYIAGYVGSIIALVYFSKMSLKDAGRKEVISLAAFGTIFALFAAASIVYIMMAYGKEVPLYEMFIYYFYPVGSAVLFILSSSIYVFFRKTENVQKPLLLISVSFLFAFFGDVLYTYYSLNEVYGAAGVTSDIFYLVDYSLVAIAFYLLSFRLKEAGKEYPEKERMGRKSPVLSVLIGVVFVTSAMVIIGWLADIAVLKSILPGFVTMKFSTAIAFLITAMILVGVSQSFGKGSINKKVTLFFSIVLLVLMGYLLIASLYGTGRPLDNFVIRESEGAVMTIKSGLPSAATMLNFTLIALVGILSFFSHKPRLHKFFGEAIGFIGFSAIMGYVFNQPHLYFYFENISSAMALHTAFLFVIIGMVVYILAKKDQEAAVNSVGEMIFAGFFIIIFLIIFLMGIVSQLNSIQLDKTQQIRDVEVPLEFMVEQVKGYDSILTEQALQSLIDAENYNFDSIREHRAVYDEVGIKLDDLLKTDAKTLLERSRRTEEEKNRTLEFINGLNELNLKLVDI
ncbi:MAG: hypothetical protein PHP46_06890, partial [Candidatus Omnitrophica bacterium]|nr:hypothetical protein [Candidatus Omnitrophota bacterium]